MNPASFHIVLVEPGNSLNIGSVARAMMNIGFSNLHLVAPPHFDIAQAAITACWAKPLLERAIVNSSLEEAVAPMQSVVGFSVRQGKNVPEQLLLPAWSDRIQHTPALKTALLFGPEDNGLCSEHVAQCRTIVRIPSHAEFPSFNLAQAVLLVLYELDRLSQPLSAQVEPAERPIWSEFNQLDEYVNAAATLCGFYHQGTPNHMPRLLQTLFRRLDPDRREMSILLGLFSNILRVLQSTDEAPSKR